VHGVTFKINIIPGRADKFVAGQDKKVMTFLNVREDALELFGFDSPAELSLFERLLTVSGVGPRLALGVLSAGQVSDLENAIDRGDAALLTKVSGVGTKTAERIIVDLRGKLNDLHDAGDTDLSAIIDALIGLGYSAREARDAARLTAAEESVENRIRAALKQLGRKP